MKILLQTVMGNMLLTEREARKNIKLNFEGENQSDWCDVVYELYGLECDITIMREIAEILGEDLDGVEIECQPGDEEIKDFP